VEQEAEAQQNCQVHYGVIHREARCNEIGSIMLSELRIPTSVRVVVRPSHPLKVRFAFVDGQVAAILAHHANKGLDVVESQEATLSAAAPSLRPGAV
jgi:hypothetical protein